MSRQNLYALLFGLLTARLIVLAHSATFVSAFSMTTSSAPVAFVTRLYASSARSRIDATSSSVGVLFCQLETNVSKGAVTFNKASFSGFLGSRPCRLSQNSSVENPGGGPNETLIETSGSLAGTFWFCFISELRALAADV